MTDTQSMSHPRKKAFIISPIGRLDDDGFDFTELFLNNIVVPAIQEAGGYDPPQRADHAATPGPITGQIIRDIIEADVCIADLTGHNPNVMYEIAIAHAADKPVILLKQGGGGGPFDIKDERAISYGTRADLAENAKIELVKQLQHLGNTTEVYPFDQELNPVRAIFKRMKQRDDAIAADDSGAVQAFLDRLDVLEGKIDSLHKARNLDSHSISSSHREVDPWEVATIESVLSRVASGDDLWQPSPRLSFHATHLRSRFAPLKIHANWNTPESRKFLSYLERVSIELSMEIDELIKRSSSGRSTSETRIANLLEAIDSATYDFGSLPNDA